MSKKEIVSRSNPTFRRLSKISKGRGIRKNRLTLLSGRKQVREILRDFSDRCVGIILPLGQQVGGEVAPEGIPTYRLGAELFREVDTFGTGPPILLIEFSDFPQWTDDSGPEGCTLFVPFQDPVNVGAVVRSAAAFGVSRIVLLKEAAHPFHLKATRVSGSAIFRTPILEGPSVNELGRTEIPIIALSPEGEDVGRFSFPSTFGLLPGLEGPGIPTSLSHLTTIGIPMESGVESLNVSTATGIALHVWRTEKRDSDLTPVSPHLRIKKTGYQLRS